MKEAIQLTSKLYQCHATATNFFKDEWPVKFNNWKAVIENVMKRDKCQEIEAAITLSKAIGDDGGTLMVMLATVAEMIEPDLRKSK